MTNPTDTLIVDTSNGKLRGKRMGGVHAVLECLVARGGRASARSGCGSTAAERRRAWAERDVMPS